MFLEIELCFGYKYKSKKVKKKYNKDENEWLINAYFWELKNYSVFMSSRSI
jgi:hypothetical protein